MLGCFYFWVVKKRFILETGGKPKEIFLLEIGGKLREKECWDFFIFLFLQRREICAGNWRKSQRENVGMFFAVKKNSKPRIEKLELASNDFFLLEGRKEGASC